MRFQKDQVRGFAVAMGGTLLGSCFCGIAINFFYNPSHLLSGGFPAIAQLLNFQFGWSLSITNFIITIPLLILAWFLLSPRLCVYDLFGTAMFSLAIEIFSWFPAPEISEMTSMILGGLLYGTGCGIILRSGGLAGGNDILCRIMNKYFSINLGTTGLIVNATTLTAYLFMSNIDLVVLTLVAVFISAQANNFVNHGIDHRRAVMIITNKEAEISQAIMSQMERGVTVFDARGAYTHDTRSVLYCVISAMQVAPLKRIIRSIDPNAFFTITEAQTVYGRGKGFHKVTEIDG